MNVALSLRSGISDEKDEAGRVDLFRYRWNRSQAGLAAIAMGVLGYHARWICDDALIFTRTVEQILAGNGPVYSPGERAEASTSTLWQWLLVLAGFVLRQDDTSTIAWVLGLLLTVGGFAVAVDATRRAWLGHAHGVERFMIPFGVLIPLALRPVWEYATSGLETGLTTMWLASCWWVLVRLRAGGSRRGVLGAAAVMGLGPLVRPDLALPAVVFLVALWVLARPALWLTLAAVVAAGALPVAYQIFRMGYYGIVFPMPALTKEAGASLWGRGFGYVTDFTGPYVLWLPLIGVVIGIGALLRAVSGRRADLVLVMTPVTAGALLLVYVVKVGGDYMHARMLLPILFLVLLPVLLVPLGRVFVPVTGVLLVWALVCGISMRFSPTGGLGEKTDNERDYYVLFTRDSHPTTSEDFARTQTGTLDVIRAEIAAGRRSLVYYGPGFENIVVPLRADVPGDVAVVGIYLGVVGDITPVDGRVVDFWGLANPVGARFDLPTTKPGHSKPMSNAWILAEYADPAAPIDPRGNYARPGPVTAEEVAAARRALECGDLKELRDAAREPMSAGRFWKNLTGAWGRTHIAIPADPFEAERRFCGSDAK